MKKEFKKASIEVVRLKKMDIIATSCPIHCPSNSCPTDCTGDSCLYKG